MMSQISSDFIITSLVLIITPGPTTLYLLSIGAVKGKKAAMSFIMGLIGGLILHILLFTFGFSDFIIRSEAIFRAVKILGACYLFWLAYKVYKCKGTLEVDENKKETVKKSSLGFMGQGFFMNFINPQVMMFFLAFFPKFILNTTENVVRHVLTLGAVFTFQSALFFVMVGLLASQLTNILKHNLWIDTFLKWMQIVVFIGVGIYVLL